ncbi:lysosomal protective protein-like [Lytechinus variegatus]|uniref:lysosomal protective protein-like n=1 Tax=Lytechinus variegatus TaxID=7654 RepID=UPI001BB1C78C|nr:lysosomal protective protein-like [Lytechinus variegatus]
MLYRILISFLLAASCFAAYAPDEVTNLPGIPSEAPPFKQYSGYLNATGDKLFHYWFVESQSSPSVDPVVLWLNGGPGCSSLDGYLSELGPFHVNSDGATLYLNDYSWNKQANVIFLESPAGVGFSYSPSGDIKTDDDQVAEDNFQALQNFFVKFPEYLNNTFYLTGESYGGIYIPTLALKIMKGNTSIKLEGFAIGNGLLNVTSNYDSAIYFGYYHALFDQDVWNDLQTYCCKNGVCQFFQPTDQQCKDACDIAESFIYRSGINTYNIYQDCTGGIPTQTKRYQFDLWSSLGIHYKTPHPKHFEKPQTNSSLRSTLYASHGFMTSKVGDPECSDTTAVTTYLGRADVRLALHIPASVQPWEVCSDAVGGNYTMQYQSVKPLIESMLTKYRGLFYNGDADIVCNFLGAQWFVKDLHQAEKTSRRPWKVGTQVAGFAHEFLNVTVATVKGSGHLVPMWKPAEAYHMITQFLNNQPL